MISGGWNLGLKVTMQGRVSGVFGAHFGRFKASMSHQNLQSGCQASRTPSTPITVIKGCDLNHAHTALPLSTSHSGVFAKGRAPSLAEVEMVYYDCKMRHIDCFQQP